MWLTMVVVLIFYNEKMRIHFWRNDNLWEGREMSECKLGISALWWNCSFEKDQSTLLVYIITIDYLFFVKFWIFGEVTNWSVCFYSSPFFLRRMMKMEIAQGKELNSPQQICMNWKAVFWLIIGLSHTSGRNH